MAGAGPAVTLPIFDAGRLRGNLAGKDADYDIAVEQYNQTLADAMRDVVDQLASFRSVDEQRAQQQQALATTREAYDLALLRYREGLGNYLQVLSAEQPLLAQQSLDADLRARELELSINLVRALGGGYEPPLTLGEVRHDTTTMLRCSSAVPSRRVALRRPHAVGAPRCRARAPRATAHAQRRSLAAAANSRRPGRADGRDVRDRRGRPGCPTDAGVRAIDTMNADKETL